MSKDDTPKPGRVVARVGAATLFTTMIMLTDVQILQLANPDAPDLSEHSCTCSGMSVMADRIGGIAYEKGPVTFAAGGITVINSGAGAHFPLWYLASGPRKT